MPDGIVVISSNIDGAQLRREKYKNSYHTRCDGKKDQEQFNEAIVHAGTMQYSISSERWDDIFGDK